MTISTFAIALASQLIHAVVCKGLIFLSQVVEAQGGREREREREREIT